MAESKPGMFRKSAQAVKENKSGSYKIQSGDTLSQIAKSRGTTVEKLMEMNPSIKNANQIRAGASLKLPPKTEVSKMTGSKSSPYLGMSSKEITSGSMMAKGGMTKSTPMKKMAGGEMKPTKTMKEGGMTKKTKGMAAGGMTKKTKASSMGGVARGMGAATKGGNFTRGG